VSASLLEIPAGIRSKHYDPAPSAGLFYECESLGLINGTAVTGVASASGGHVASNTSLPAGAWVSVLTTTPAVTGTPMTHTGSYRVWCRAYSATATPQLQFLWGVGSLSVPQTNDPVTLPGKGAFYLLDLGEIRLDAPPVGTNEWFGVVQVQVANADDPIYLDCLYFQPIDDGAGELTYVPTAPVSSIAIGPNPPVTGTNDATVGTTAWTNPGRVTAADGSYATVALSGGSSSEYLKATGFGFSIPAGAVIEGIQLDVLRFESSPGVGDNSVKLVKAGSIVGADRAVAGAWPTSPAYATYGSATDLWGTSWSVSDVNNSGFGAAVSALGVFSPTAEIDFMRITVYYALTGFAVVQDAVVYADGTTELRYDGMVRTPGSGAYGPVSNVEGDLPRLPSSGLENRVCQLFIKPTRGDLDALPDSGLDGFTVQVRYRPTYLSRP